MCEKKDASIRIWLTSFFFIAMFLTVSLFAPESFAQQKLLKTDSYGDGYKVVGVTRKAEQVSEIAIPDSSDFWKNPFVAVADHAFDSCQKLTSIHFGKFVSEIDPDIFVNLKTLTQIRVSEGNSQYFSNEGILYRKEGLGALIVCYPQGKTEDICFINQVVRKGGGNSAPFIVTRIGYAAFYKSQLTTVNIPKSVEEIGDYAFKDSRNLKTVTLNEGLKKIGKESFAGCSSITAITLPETLESVGEKAFMGGQMLKKIRIPKNVTSIGEDAFCDCLGMIQFDVASENENYAAMDGVLFTKSYDSLVVYPSSRSNDNYAVPKQTKKLGTRAFANNQAIQTATIPEGISSVSISCFANCSVLKKVELPKSVEKINEGAFQGCSSLASINFSENLKTIDKDAFKLCASLKSVELPEGLESIQASAFAHCSSLESIRIPSTVTSIGSGAFEGCSSLKRVELPKDLSQKINAESVFKGCDSVGDIHTY